MLKLEGKYGDIHINGMSIDVEKTSIQDLTKYLQKLQIKRTKLIETQNECLSQIIK